VIACFSVSVGRLGQGRLGCALESGPVRVFEISRIEQRGKADHRVHPGGAGGKCLEGMVGLADNPRGGSHRVPRHPALTEQHDVSA
jgi:hypothetical protein